MKISDKIQKLADKKLKEKMYQISVKEKKLIEANSKLIGVKVERMKKKAERDVMKRAENQERKSQGKELKPKKVNLVKKLDDLWSKYIRLKYPPFCYTCGGTKHIGCGHFITRKVRELRWDERNTRPQGFYCCNAKFSGNGQVHMFESKLKAEGIDTDALKVIELLAGRSGGPKPKPHELEEKIKEYEQKLLDLKSTKK